jgi:hypothetical protein
MEEENIAPRILDHVTRYREVVSFTDRSFYPYLIGGWVIPRIGLYSMDKRKFFLLLGIKTQ